MYESFITRKRFPAKLIFCKQLFMMLEQGYHILEECYSLVCPIEFSYGRRKFLCIAKY